MDEQQESQGQRFSLVRGGPFNALMGRAGLLGPDRLPTARAAFGIALLSWCLPGLFALAQSLRDPGSGGLVYFTDPTTLSRFFLATGILLTSERRADRRLGEIIEQFWQARLLRGSARAAFFDRLRDAERLSSSTLAETLILVAALVAARYNLQLAIGLQHAGWEGVTTGGDTVVSWAGHVAQWSGLPLFMFLVIRALWRLLVWSKLLFHVSRLPLSLVPLHADRCAGLGFLSLFPGVFQGVVFAIGCVVASIMFKHIAPEQSLRAVDGLLWWGGAWLGFVLLIFVGPLFVFTGPLLALREAEITTHGRVVNRWYRRFHEQWISADVDTPRDVDDHPDGRMPDLEDLNVAMAALRDMRPLPVDRIALLQLLFSAAAPLLVVAATKLPFRQLVGSIVGVVL